MIGLGEEGESVGGTNPVEGHISMRQDRSKRRHGKVVINSLGDNVLASDTPTLSGKKASS